MDLTKKQLEFWTFLLLIILSAAVLILLVDFGIKAAILEESTSLRLKIEEWNGRNNPKANTSRVGNDTTNDAAVSVPLLVDKPTRMETGNVPNGVAKASATTGNRRRSKPKGQTDNSGISDGNESVG